MQLPCLKYRDLQEKCLLADPYNKDNVSDIWNGHLSLNSPTWFKNTVIVPSFQLFKVS